MKTSEDTMLVMAKPTILEDYVTTRIRRDGTVLDALKAVRAQEVPASNPERIRSREQLAREMAGHSWAVFAQTAGGKIVELDPKKPVAELPGDVLVPKEVQMPSGEVQKILALQLEVQSYQAVGTCN